MALVFYVESENIFEAGTDNHFDTIREEVYYRVRAINGGKFH
jgi:hypothetical protein